MNNLIEISRDKTGFFTSIFVYDSKGKIPKNKVYKMGMFESHDYSYYVNYIYFKDIETGKLLKFSVEEDCTFLGKVTKNTNMYLIKEMEKFARLHWCDINDYYEGVIDIKELVSALKIKTLPVPESISYTFRKNRFTDETFMYYKNLSKRASIQQEIKASGDVFQVLFCKCILWHSAKDAVEYWQNLIAKNLIELSKTIVENCEYNGEFKSKDEELLNLFFELEDGINTLEFQCNIILDRDDSDSNILISKLGRPFVIDGEDGWFDLKVFEEKYNEFKENFCKWYFNKYKNHILEIYKTKIGEGQITEIENDLQKELLNIVKEISNIKEKVIDN